MNKNWCFAALSMVAAALAAITLHPIFGFLGLAVAIGLIIFDYILKQAAEERLKECIIPISPSEWNVKWEQEMAMDAELIILSSKHGKGSNINVKVKQPEFKRYDLEDTITETGDIVIRYANNNFPLDPRIALCVHVSARD